MLVLAAVLFSFAGVTLWLVTRRGGAYQADSTATGSDLSQGGVPPGSGFSKASSPYDGPEIPMLPPLPLTDDQRARVERLRSEFENVSELAFQSYEDESQMPAAKDALWDLKAGLKEGEGLPPELWTAMQPLLEELDVLVRRSAEHRGRRASRAGHRLAELMARTLATAS